jgi:hypothetical protein
MMSDVTANSQQDSYFRCDRLFIFAKAGHFALRLSFLMSGNICRQQANAFEALSTGFEGFLESKMIMLWNFCCLTVWNCQEHE